MSKELLRLEPVFQEKIWGGDRLRTVFHYDIPSDHTGECWAISGHPSGDCHVKNPEFAGETLGSLWKKRPDLFGNLPGDSFPLLVKIIDAKDDLSIQVHPDDSYAAVHEHGARGKTECWYVLDCDPGTTIVIGHNAKTREEMGRMVEERRWKELIREVPIQKGDFFQINPGCLHAIKGGTLILETQQSSDVTYRFYDYDRLSDGKPRPLHIAQSLAVTQVPHSLEAPKQETCRQGGAEITHLVTCPYYAVYRVRLDGRWETNWEQPFVNVSITGRLRHPGRPAGEQGGPSPDSRRLRTDGSGGEPGAYLLSFVIGTKINTGKPQKLQVSAVFLHLGVHKMTTNILKVYAKRRRVQNTGIFSQTPVEREAFGIYAQGRSDRDFRFCRKESPAFHPNLTILYRF